MAVTVRGVPEAVGARMGPEGPRAVRVQTRVAQAQVPPRPGEVAPVRVVGAPLGPVVAALLARAPKAQLRVGQVAPEALQAAHPDVQVSVPSTEGAAAGRRPIHEGQPSSVATPDAAIRGQDAHGQWPLEEQAH